MYGINQDKKRPLHFDLEKQIQDPEEGKKVLEKAEWGTRTIKGMLRAGTQGQDFDRLGILLQGYMALKKVLRKAMN
jgi:hypothetical protein